MTQPRATDTPAYVQLAGIDGSASPPYLPGGIPVAGIPRFGFITFQEGPVREVGVNGTSMEVVLQVVLDRLAGYQRGPFPCIENESAFESITAALDALNERTAARREQGVEGINAPHASR